MLILWLTGNTHSNLSTPLSKSEACLYSSVSSPEFGKMFHVPNDVQKIATRCLIADYSGVKSTRSPAVDETGRKKRRGSKLSIGKRTGSTSKLDYITSDSDTDAANHFENCDSLTNG